MKIYDSCSNKELPWNYSSKWKFDEIDRSFIQQWGSQPWLLTEQVLSEFPTLNLSYYP